MGLGVNGKTHFWLLFPLRAPAAAEFWNWWPCFSPQESCNAFPKSREPFADEILNNFHRMKELKFLIIL